MNLIRCPDCSSAVSTEANSCPKCGYVLQRRNTGAAIATIIAGVVLTLLFGLLGLLVVGIGLLSLMAAPMVKTDAVNKAMPLDKSIESMPPMNADQLRAAESRLDNLLAPGTRGVISIDPDSLRIRKS
jgi:hypothetical protein